MRKLKRKLKRLYNKNKILFVLITILAVCFIIIVIGLITSFFKGIGTNQYGDRLDGIKAVKINDSDKNKYASSFEEIDSVENATVDIKGRIIYVMVTMDDGIGVKTAKKDVGEKLDIFDEDIIKFYDIQFIISGDDDGKYVTMGYKNSNRDEIVWINRN